MKRRGTVIICKLMRVILQLIWAGRLSMAPMDYCAKRRSCWCYFVVITRYYRSGYFLSTYLKRGMVPNLLNLQISKIPTC